MLRRLAATVTIGAFLAMPALAEPHTGLPEREVESVGPWAFKRIERMHKDLQDQEYGYVLDTLNEMKRNDRLNSHEQALMWQGFGYAYIGTEDFEKAADALSNCLATEGLPIQGELHTRYNLAQILVMLERPQEAITEFEKWFPHARNPSPTAYYMAAMAHMQAGNREQAIEHVDVALSKASSPRESWLQLKSAMLIETKDFEGAEAVLEQLIERFPKKAYWMQLAALYSQTKRPDRALTTLEMIYMQGWLERESEYLTLAQMYLFNQIPYRAAEVLRDGLEKGVVSDSAKSWQLLADSWLHARERDRALPPMRKAADLAKDGNVYLRLGQLHVDREEWSEAKEALERAIEKGELRHPGHAQLLLGIAYANSESWGPAQRAFVAASEDEKTEKAAQYWLKQIASKQGQGEDSQQRAAIDGANRQG